MSDLRHRPVMLQEMLDALAPVAGETYIDATFGAGGYSRAILETADCSVIGIDRDPDAVAEAQPLAEAYRGRLAVRQGRFSEMERIAADEGRDAIHGVAMDLGVSSMQLDRAERGFSFMHDGALDMRMSQSGESAADVVNGASEEALADIFYYFGGERRARRVARAVVEARLTVPIERTAQLADIVARVVPRNGRIHPATKAFQGLRIYVNSELDELRQGLCAAERLLAPGGRLVVISFHSLEDGDVKRFMDDRSGIEPGTSRHLPEVRRNRSPASFLLPKRGVVKPLPAEVKGNPRARSARLRLAVRTDAPAWLEEAAA